MDFLFVRDTYFTSALENLLKITDKAEFTKKSKELICYTIEKDSPALAFILALEFDSIGVSVTRLQNFIINSGNARYIFRFAREIKKANIKRLQSAMTKFGNILQIAKFGCFIRDANKNEIQKLIIKSCNAKSAYLYLKYVKYCDINKLKPIIIKSKKPRYLFALAKLIKNKKDLSLIQDLIIASPSNAYVRLFAKHIPGADIEKLENRIIATNDLDEMRKFAKYIKSPRLSKLIILF